jgi:hypothetical protein
MRKRTNPALLAVFVFALLIAVMVPAVAAASSHWLSGSSTLTLGVLRVPTPMTT